METIWHTSGASSSKWNPFKSSKATPIPLPAFDEEDTNTAIQASIQDQQMKMPLMKKISQTLNNGVKSLKYKASKRFSVPSAAQQGSSISAAGSSKKANIDVVVLSSELDELDIAEEPRLSAGPITPRFTASEIRKGKFKERIMDVEAKPDTSSKKHKCSEPGCDYSFTSASHLKIHMFVHSGLKPHKCTECDYSCTSASNLKKHMASHENSRSWSYECPYQDHGLELYKSGKGLLCGSKFQNSVKLDYHILYCHTSEGLDKRQSERRPNGHLFDSKRNCF